MKTIPYAPDFASLKALIFDFLQNPSLANTGTVVMRHQIEQFVRGEFGSDTMVLEISMRTVRRACSLINTRAIVEMVEADFFDFQAFFRSFPRGYGGFQELVSSRLLDEAYVVRRSLFTLICNNYSDEIARTAIIALHKFQSELQSARFVVDKNPIFAAMTAVRTVQSLSDVATTFECLDSFIPKENDQDLVSSSWALRLRMLVLALERRINKLIVMNTPMFKSLFVNFKIINTALKGIPVRLGFISAKEAGFRNFKSHWKTFCSSVVPIPLTQLFGAFKQLTETVIVTLQSNIAANPAIEGDIGALETLVGLFNVTHDHDLLFKLSLAFLYFDSLIYRYAPGPAANLLPFARIQTILRSLMTIYEVEMLIFEITNRINAISPGEEIQRPEVTFIDTPLVEEDEPVDEPGEQLSFEDQTALAQMVNVFMDANQRLSERLADEPVVKSEVEEIVPMIDQMNKENAHLFEVNSTLYAVLSKLVDSVQNHSENNTDAHCHMTMITSKLDDHMSRVKSLRETAEVSETRAQKLFDEVSEADKQLSLLECDVEKANFDVEVADGAMETLVKSVMQMKQSHRDRAAPCITDPVYADTVHIAESVDELRSLHRLCVQEQEEEKKQAEARKVWRNPKEQEEKMKQEQEIRESKREVIKSLIEMFDGD